MPDASMLDPDVEPQAASVTNVSGGVNLDSQRDIHIGGDIVGRDKITTIGYTVEQVSTLLAQISSTFQPKPFDGRCPYLGLDAFSEDDADRFFGREKLVEELVARVKESRFVVIAGPSGSGKSSLVRAGLIFSLRQGALPALHSDRWLYATFTPGRDPIESLALAMSRMAKSPDAGDYIRGHKTEVDALHKFTESVLTDRTDQRAVIYVDQFEEVFTQVSKEDERVAFLNLLAHAASIEGGRVTVLFALRSDFVSNCATYPQLNALLNQQFMQVGAMQPDELVSAIARPALQVGLRIAPDLVAQIVNDMQDEPGALPLMQFALKDLFDAQQAAGGVVALTLDDYLARGGLRKALERHADAAFAGLSVDEQRLARTIFSGLIEIGRGTQDSRRTATFDELVPVHVARVEVEAVIHKLADAPARLLTTDEQEHRVTVTLAHERLIEAWPWLRKLVNENREAIFLQNEITEAAQEWDEHQRDESYLYTGARLGLSRARIKAQNIQVSEQVHAFVQAGILVQRRERIRRISTPIVVLLIASLLLGGGFLGYSLILRTQARGETVLVPAGEFALGAADATDVLQNRQAAWRARVPEFRIEKYEVTNAQYRLCVQDRSCSEPANLALYEGSGKATMPVVEITLKQAADYCQWIGRRIPTEIQWEWAARGPEGWKYPAGNEDPDPRLVNIDDFETDRSEHRFAVNQLAADKRGTFGLAGNVMEWTVSLWLEYDNPVYATTLWESKSFQPIGPNQMVVARGGSWAGTISQALSTSRYPIDPTVPADYVGVRCVEREGQ